MRRDAYARGVATPVIQQVVVVPAPQDAVMSQLMSVSGADSYSPVGQSYDTLTLSRRRIPVWAIVLAIILFPIGLLFLLVKDTEMVQITLNRVEGGTQVTIAGRASQPLMSALQYALSGYQATPAGLPQPTGPMPGPTPAGPPPGYGAPPLPDEPTGPTPRIPAPYGPSEPAPPPPTPPPPPPGGPPPGGPLPGGVPGGAPPGGPPPGAPSFGPPGEQWQPPAQPGSPPPGSPTPGSPPPGSQPPGEDRD